MLFCQELGLWIGTDKRIQLQVFCGQHSFGEIHQAVRGVTPKMAEELAEAMRKFQLSCKEEEGVSLDSVDMKSSVESCKMSVLGKVFGDKKPTLLGCKISLY